MKTVLIVLFSLLVLYFIFSGLWIFSSKREHMLSVLLSLEYMTLGVFLMILLALDFWGLYYSLLYIMFTACEGAMGLSILVMMSRTHGGDYFKSFNIL